MLPIFTLLIVLGQIGAQADESVSSDITEEAISEVRQAFRERAMMASDGMLTGDLAHGAFANDPNLCISAFSRQYHPVSIEDYLIETRYAGPSVTYTFFSLDIVDQFYDDAERTAPVSQSFSCTRHGEWGPLLLLRVLE